MPKIPNPFDKPKGKMGRKLLPRKDPKPFGNYGQGPNMPSNKLPKPAPQRKKKPLRAGVDTRPTERDSQTKKYKYGPPRTARDLELAPRPRPRTKNPKRQTGPSYNFGPPKRKKLGVYKPKKGM
jgi:hypothetical protein